MQYHGRRQKNQPTWESLRMDKWKATLPLLTISIVQYDTHMTSQSLTEYPQDYAFAKHFQTPKAPYTLRARGLYREVRFHVPSGSLRGILLHKNHNAVTASYRGATKAIKTLPSQYYWGSLAKDLRGYVRVKPISAQRLIDSAVPVSSPRIRHPRRSGPKCPLISCLNHQKRKLVLLDKLCWFINSPNNLHFCS
jgi:hypothetical protein